MPGSPYPLRIYTLLSGQLPEGHQTLIPCDSGFFPIGNTFESSGNLRSHERSKLEPGPGGPSRSSEPAQQLLFFNETDASLTVPHILVQVDLNPSQYPLFASDYVPAPFEFSDGSHATFTKKKCLANLPREIIDPSHTTARGALSLRGQLARSPSKGITACFGDIAGSRKIKRFRIHTVGMPFSQKRGRQR